MGYSVLEIAGVEAAGPGGVVKFLRRELGVEAFGVNWFEGLTMIAVGARRGSHEPRGPF